MTSSFGFGNSSLTFRKKYMKGCDTYLRFLRHDFFFPPVARLLCVESREIPEMLLPGKVLENQTSIYTMSNHWQLCGVQVLIEKCTARERDGHHKHRKTTAIIDSPIDPKGRPNLKLHNSTTSAKGSQPRVVSSLTANVLDYPYTRHTIQFPIYHNTQLSNWDFHRWTRRTHGAVRGKDLLEQAQETKREWVRARVPALGQCSHSSGALHSRGQTLGLADGQDGRRPGSTARPRVWPSKYY